MIKQISLYFFLILLTKTGFSQFKLNEWVDEIKYTIPDTNDWVQVSKYPAIPLMNGEVQFIHTPILDPLQRPVEPIIALLYQERPDSIDLIMYSANAIGSKPYRLNYTPFPGYPDYSIEKSSIFFKGNYYRSGIKHTIIIGYIIHNDLLIELICDSTDLVYKEVESDFLKFIKSVHVQ
tara:strand:+ start:70 stop:603 length:534 start_codon:yes stop_codon:yes gene_type:complete